MNDYRKRAILDRDISRVMGQLQSAESDVRKMAQECLDTGETGQQLVAADLLDMAAQISATIEGVKTLRQSALAACQQDRPSKTEAEKRLRKHRIKV